MRSTIVLLMTVFALCTGVAHRAMAQQAPIGSHYAGRESDTGFGDQVSPTGGFAASVPIELPAIRGDLGVPLTVSYTNGTAYGVAGRGWDIDLAFVSRPSTLARRRPGFDTMFDGMLAAPERVTLRLAGVNQWMVPVDDAGTYRPRMDSQDVTLRAEGERWVAEDGAGRRYEFERLAGFPDAGLWWLTRMHDRTRQNHVALEYEVFPHDIAGTKAYELRLSRLRYNFHPSGACAKHEVRLHYTPPGFGPTPQALSIADGILLAQTQILASIEVLAMNGETCSAALLRTRSYEFSYESEPDTKLPRLMAVDARGVEGTPEADIRLPLVRFEYAFATKDLGIAPEAAAGRATLPRQLQFIEGLGMDLPPEAAAVNTAFASMHDSPHVYTTRHVLQDYTGDSVPDLVFPHAFDDRDMQIARGRASKTGTGFEAPAAFASDEMADLPLARQDTTSPRYYYPGEEVVRETTWVQTIDFNADGRLDILDAGQEVGQWVLWLNTPGAAAGDIVWRRTLLNVGPVIDRLRARGFPIGDRLPLSTSQTGRRWREGRCWLFTGSTWVAACTATPDRQVTYAGDERTIVEWKLEDANGDGYPDFLYNAQPVRLHLTKEEGCPPTLPPEHAGTERVCTTEWDLDLDDPPTNRLIVLYNRAGVRLGGTRSPFTTEAAFLGDEAAPCGLEQWGLEEGRQRLTCGIADVNGDGLADRIDRQDVRLGTGGGFTGVALQLPGPAHAVENTRAALCKDKDAPDYNPDQEYLVATTASLIDLTGDGIPDYVSRSRLGDWSASLGTGTGFAEAIPISSPYFSISTTVETCGGGASRVIAGLVDVDADGHPDAIRMGDPGTLRVSRAVSSTGNVGSRDAGRIVVVRNGDGAATAVRYGSAKADPKTTHQLPYPEVVVERTETTGHAPVDFAYGHADQHFDVYADRWVFSGYGRTVRLAGALADPGRVRGTVAITERILYSDVTETPDMEDWLYRRLALAGRIRDHYLLDGAFEPDAWAFLDVDVATHSGWHGNQNVGWAVVRTPGSLSGVGIDCTDLSNPHDFQASVADGSAYKPTCRQTGFAYPREVTAWGGDKPPATGEAVMTYREIQRADEYGRPLWIFHENDTRHDSDDVCEVLDYASAATSMRVLDLVHRRRFVAVPTELEPNVPREAYCQFARVPFAGIRYHYDGRSDDKAEQGLLTATFVALYDAETGDELGGYFSHISTYDAFGNTHTVTSYSDASTWQRAEVGLDGFKLVGTSSSITASGTDVAITESASYDHATLMQTSATDPNGTVTTTRYDGFQRPTHASVVLDDGQEYLFETREYLGDEGGTPEGRRMRATQFRERVLLESYLSDPSIATSAGTPATIYFDELGRMRRVAVELGKDYEHARVITHAAVYDSLGRVMFAPDPYLDVEGTEPTAQYGTSYHYRSDGSLECAVRGPGYQPLTWSTDLSKQIFPTCTTRSYADGRAILDVYAPESLRAESAEHLTHRRIVRTAVGWPLTTSTQKPLGDADEVLDFAEYSHSRLGHLLGVRRYQDAAAPSLAVPWQFRADSQGRFMEIREPGALPRTRHYDFWGNAVQENWVDSATGTAVTRGVRKTYDGFGRLVRQVELADGAELLSSELLYHYDKPQDSPHHRLPGALLGRLAHASSPTMDVFFGYDALGNLRAESWVGSDGVLYAQEHDYYFDGTLRTITFLLPDNEYQRETARYELDSAGRNHRIVWEDAFGAETVFEATAINAFGNYESVRLGNGVQEVRTHPNSGLRELRSLDVVGANASQHIAFSGYDAHLRETARQEYRWRPGVPLEGQTISHLYDKTGRLHRSSRKDMSGETFFDEAYTYDDLGNLRLVQDFIGPHSVIMSVSTVDRDRVCHAERLAMGRAGTAGGLPESPLTAIDPEASCSYRYDGMGNVVRRSLTDGSTQELRYDGWGHPVELRQGEAVAAFRYGPFGEVTELDVTGVGPGRDRQDRRYGTLIERAIYAEEAGPTVRIERTIPGPLGAILTRRGAGSDAVRLYRHTDYQGTRWTTDREGAFVQELAYRPYGGVLSATGTVGSDDYTKYQWNAGDALAGFDVLHVGARLYDPKTGRFLQRDPLMAPGRGAGSHPYAFGFSDPVNVQDPSGLDGTIGCIEYDCPGEVGPGVWDLGWTQYDDPALLAWLGILFGSGGQPPSHGGPRYDLSYTPPERSYKPPMWPGLFGWATMRHTLVDQSQGITGLHARMDFQLAARGNEVASRVTRRGATIAAAAVAAPIAALNAGAAGGFVLESGVVGTTSLSVSSWLTVRAPWAIPAAYHISASLVGMTPPASASRIAPKTGLAVVEKIRQWPGMGKHSPGSIAYAEVILEDGRAWTVVAAAGKKWSHPLTAPVPEMSKRLFEATTVDYWRGYDAEVKLLEYVARQLPRDAKGIVRIFSEKKFCDSCAGVIGQFDEMFPELLVLPSHGGRR